ncbi:hypothetical protein PGTUg99_020127 [Puccinia graminis f. sp. tritici]|uniref:Uncharacterized protein n=1 Tax=Puccinia graminis f. sp. tritici TaxID=56615 RepID=A0A5B0SBB1_PUCGR|nr:hypothetical protein PGTUg99_020127 [Puccinia graminis f. sp. tritici]
MFHWVTNVESKEGLEDPSNPTNNTELSLMKEHSTCWADSEMTKLIVRSSTITIIGFQTAIHAIITSLFTQFQIILDGATLPDF